MGRGLLYCRPEWVCRRLRRARGGKPERYSGDHETDAAKDADEVCLLIVGIVLGKPGVAHGEDDQQGTEDQVKDPSDHGGSVVDLRSYPRRRGFRTVSTRFPACRPRSARAGATRPPPGLFGRVAWTAIRWRRCRWP